MFLLRNFLWTNTKYNDFNQRKFKFTRNNQSLIDKSIFLWRFLILIVLIYNFNGIKKTTFKQFKSFFSFFLIYLIKRKRRIEKTIKNVYKSSLFHFFAYFGIELQSYENLFISVQCALNQLNTPFFLKFIFLSKYFSEIL